MTNRVNMRERFVKMREEDGFVKDPSQKKHKARTRKAARKRAADRRMKERTKRNQENV